MANISYIFYIFLAFVLVAAALYDLRFQKIPNLLTFPTMGVAIVYYGITIGGKGILISTSGLLLGMALFITPYLMGGMGAGDVKLMGAVGAVLGPWGVVNAAILTAFAGGVYALYIIITRHEDCKKMLSRFALMIKHYVNTGKMTYIPAPGNENVPKLCYGVAIFLGTLCTMWWKLSQNSFPI
jgi:prepilin peptidase CpaA